MYKIVKNGNVVHSYIVKLIADHESDVATLPNNDSTGIEAGSTCYITDTGNVYILNTVDQWVKIPSQSTDTSMGVVSTVQELPQTFTISDKKLYYVIETGSFYLWNGTTWIEQIETEDIDFSNF